MNNCKKDNSLDKLYYLEKKETQHHHSTNQSIHIHSNKLAATILSDINNSLEQEIKINDKHSPLVV